MSHTSTISTVTIVDVHALRAAVQELKDKQGVNMTLEEDAMPRSYFGSSQQGMSENAPFVLRLHDARYDVGLYRNEEDNGYEARCDLYDGGIRAALGSKQTGDCTPDQAALGKLYNMYSVHAATRAAAAQGHQVQRIEKEDGAVQLVVQLAA
jgi:hypothetical protein